MTKPLAPHRQPAIYLGYPFDQLFDRNCELEFWKGSKGLHRLVPAIKLPTEQSPGTGNIVITGAPGSGKSTLALQFAVQCASRPDNLSNAAYFSLEQTVDEVISKARPFGWDEWMRPVRQLVSMNDRSTSEDSAACLWNILIGQTRSSETLKEIRARLRSAQRKRNIWNRLDTAKDLGDPTRRLFLCSLSPRPIVDCQTHEQLFWRRYQQLETVLSAADALSNECSQSKITSEFVGLEELLRRNKPSGNRSPLKDSHRFEPPGRRFLPVVVLDSLNMFGMRQLSREEVFRLFSLFRKYKRIGIFVAESTTHTPFDSTMADVVISLTNHKDRGYFVQHVEIEKSRYYNQVNGLHPYKPSSVSSRDNDGELLGPPMPYRPKSPTAPRRGIVVFPSLHYVVLRTEPEEKTKAEKSLEEPRRFGIMAFREMLPSLPRRSVLTIEGPGATSKTTLALNFLATGLHAGESGLLIRLSDIPFLRKNEVSRLRVSKELAEGSLTTRATLRQPSSRGRPPEPGDSVPDADRQPGSPDSPGNPEEPFSWGDWAPWTHEEQVGGKSAGSYAHLVPKHKTSVTVWRSKKRGRFGSPNEGTLLPPEPTLFELDFKGGALLPEEFVEIIRDFINRRSTDERKRIRRVVLDDVGQIGVSYPFLLQSLTTGDTFLSAFVHIMRNAGVDLVMIGSTTGIPKADEVVSRACSLADAVITTSFCDVFGERHVLVRGKGLMAGKAERTGRDHLREPIPAVLRFDETDRTPRTFHLDQDYLSGLLGIESGDIHRPGLLIHLFEDNELIHRKYNEDLEVMLRAGFASGSGHRAVRRSLDQEDVRVVRFGPSLSESIHGAITSFHCQERPLDQTVIFMVDEFGAKVEERNSPVRQWISFKGDMDSEEYLLATNNGLGKSSGCFWPYYSNVLLLAYRRDWVSESRALERLCGNEASWNDVLAVAVEAQAVHPESPDGVAWSMDQDYLPLVRRGFWVDLTAAESLACVLLDALGNGSNDATFGFLKKNTRLKKGQHSEVRSLAKLLQLTKPQLPYDMRGTPNDAGLYVLWFTQLRELIEKYPCLGDVLDVCALPGGGFRGDWFLGVVRGSVNRELGRRIVRVLCGHDEDKKRYVRGVALPARRAFYTRDFYAWPRGNHVTLNELLGIWEHAKSRSTIPGYAKIRQSIYALARQLMPLDRPAVSPEQIERLLETVDIGRLLDQYPVLRQL